MWITCFDFLKLEESVELIIPSTVILFLLLLIYVRIRNQRKLIEEAERYEVLLRDCRITRYQYMEALDKSREIQKERERMSNNLQVIKAELNGIRSDIRDELRFIREEIERSTEIEFDQRIIAQMKATLGEKWKFFSSRKTNYNENLARIIETKEKMEQATQKESEASSRWIQEKEMVMNLWQELSPKIQITHPHEYFG